MAARVSSRAAAQAAATWPSISSSRFGGKLDAFYYAFGDTDAILVADLPDAKSAVAVSLIANSSGGVTLKTTPLVTVEEVDAATEMGTNYRPPGA